MRRNLVCGTNNCKGKLTQAEKTEREGTRVCAKCWEKILKRRKMLSERRAARLAAHRAKVDPGPLYDEDLL